eukprot:scaffold159485_cov29-Tisochrysis_lutea.AAC.2
MASRGGGGGGGTGLPNDTPLDSPSMLDELAPAKISSVVIFAVFPSSAGGCNARWGESFTGDILLRSDARLLACSSLEPERPPSLEPLGPKMNRTGELPRPRCAPLGRFFRPTIDLREELWFSVELSSILSTSEPRRLAMGEAALVESLESRIDDAWISPRTHP